MKTIAENLGATNSLILGIIIFLAFSYWTYTAYQKGKSNIEVYKN